MSNNNHIHPRPGADRIFIITKLVSLVASPAENGRGRHCRQAPAWLWLANDPVILILLISITWHNLARIKFMDSWPQL